MIKEQPQNIAVLGSTGSIGCQTLDIIKEYPDKFRATLLTAGNNWELLAKQAKEFMPKKIVIANTSCYEPLVKALKGLSIEIECGSEAIASSVSMSEIDTVVTAMVGYSGLLPTIRAIEAGKRIALSNKETLVVAGEIITDLARKYNIEITPVDSEHSAIFQCLVGENHSCLHKIILTASGGPFRKVSQEEMEHASVEQTLKHPNWNMGAKVTVDSATMMNKGFEMIEAKWLFNCQPSDIEIVVHPQSIVHSMVEFIDGSVKAQLGVPDMRLPIRYALGNPERLFSNNQRLKLEDYSNLTFERPDYDKFPLLRYAFEAIETGGTMPCVLNAANEVGVKAFLDKRIPLKGIFETARYCLDNLSIDQKPSLEDLIECNKEAVKMASEFISSKY